MTTQSSPLSRRAVLLGSVGGAAVLGGCSATQAEDRPSAAPANATTGSPAPGAPTSGATSAGAHGEILGFGLGAPIGDGSTSEHQAQPNQRVGKPFDLTAAPPQYVVVSWDGAAAMPNDQQARFREVAKRTKAHMTFFLSGMYLVPEAKKKTYQPPAGHKPGSSAIDFLTEQTVHRTIKGIGEAWVEGHEIGTHFNGHWCHGDTSPVGSWSSEDWKVEIDEAVRFVTTWKTITGFTDLPALPFDYTKELVGARTPCLEGRKALLPTAKQLGWRYDTSATANQVWPSKLHNGMWDLSMPSVPFRGRTQLAMDYNFMYEQSGGHSTRDTASFPRWQAEATAALKAGLDRALQGNRAPFVIGNHFEQWNGGIYMNAVEELMDYAASHPEVQLVSMRELCDILDAQDPAVLARLQRLGVGQAPAGGWAELLGGAHTSGTPSHSASTEPAAPTSTATNA